jgi:hypothetical protein
MTSPKLTFKYAANFDPPRRSERFHAVMVKTFGEKVYTVRAGSSSAASVTEPDVKTN